jgi:hypothetical protein
LTLGTTPTNDQYAAVGRPDQPNRLGETQDRRQIYHYDGEPLF